MASYSVTWGMGLQGGMGAHKGQALIRATKQVAQGNEFCEKNRGSGVN